MNKQIRKILLSKPFVVGISIVIFASAWARIYLQYSYNLNFTIDRSQDWPVVKLQSEDNYFEFNPIHDTAKLNSELLMLYQDGKFTREGRVRGYEWLNFVLAVEDSIHHDQFPQQSILQKVDGATINFRKYVQNLSSTVQFSSIITQVRFRRIVSFDSAAATVFSANCASKFLLQPNQKISFDAASSAILVEQDSQLEEISFYMEVRCTK